VWGVAKDLEMRGSKAMLEQNADLLIAAAEVREKLKS
jgi:hypothetical protein